MLYENLLKEAYHHEIEIYEKPMKKRNKGLYADNVIWINRNINTSIEKACVLAEELGHYHTTSGNILDQSKFENVKQEKRARKWAYKKLVPLHKIITAYNVGIGNKHDLADYLNVTEPFLLEALYRYKEEYGISKVVNQYTIFFEPLAVMELF